MKKAQEYITFATCHGCIVPCSPLLEVEAVALFVVNAISVSGIVDKDTQNPTELCPPLRGWPAIRMMIMCRYDDFLTALLLFLVRQAFDNLSRIGNRGILPPCLSL